MAKIILKEYLSQKGIKISWLSEKSGIARPALSNLINNKTDGIKFDTIENICEVLGCEIEDILILERNRDIK